MASKKIVVKKYVVRLSAEERAQLEAFIRAGKRSAQLLTKARILLKADVSDVGDGRSDSRIAEALDTSVANIERTRRQLVEEGFESVLTRKYNPNSARPPIFDGGAKAGRFQKPRDIVAYMIPSVRQIREASACAVRRGSLISTSA